MLNRSLGFIGLGAIGLPIAANLAIAGYKLKIHTRSRSSEKDQRLKDAIPCPNPKDVAKDCDVLFVCVSDDEAIEDTLFNSEGAYQTLQPKSIVIDFSTISPLKARSIAKRLALKNVKYVDAPVTGGTEGAIAGELSIFLGCDQDMLQQINSLLEPIAKEIYCFGEVGKGQEVKAINQILVAGSFAALAEAIALGENLKLPMNLVVKALQTGVGKSWALSNRSQTMLENIYPLGFKLALHCKDLSIALKTAEEIDMDLPFTTRVKEIEQKLLNDGYGDCDLSVLKRFYSKEKSILKQKQQ